MTISSESGLLGVLERDSLLKRPNEYRGDIRLAPATGCPSGLGRIVAHVSTPTTIVAWVEKPDRDSKSHEPYCGGFIFGKGPLLGPKTIFIREENRQ